MISLQCPFHVFLFGGLAGAAVCWVSMILVGKKQKRGISNNISQNEIERYDIDARFSNAAKFQSFVFISGQVGLGSTIEEQTMSALSEVDSALIKAGTDKSRILEATIWLSNISRDYNSMNKIYDLWIPAGKPPCRACIEAKLASPEYLIEVRVIAALI